MIRDEGCKYLSRGDWPDLQHINLSKRLVIQMITKSPKKGVSTSAKPTGIN